MNRHQTMSCFVSDRFNHTGNFSWHLFLGHKHRCILHKNTTRIFRFRQFFFLLQPFFEQIFQTPLISIDIFLSKGIVEPKRPYRRTEPLKRRICFSVNVHTFPSLDYSLSPSQEISTIKTTSSIETRQNPVLKNRKKKCSLYTRIVHFSLGTN